MVPTTSRTTTDTNTIRILILYWTTKTLTFYFELIMKINFTGDYASSSMTITPVQGQFLLDFLNFIPMGEVMFDAMRDPDCDHEYFEYLCRFYCDLKKSLQDYTDPCRLHG